MKVMLTKYNLMVTVMAMIAIKASALINAYL